MFNDDCKGFCELLTPDNAGLLLIDYQPQMVFGVESMNREVLLNNLSGICKTAKLFDLPTVLTTVTAQSFSGEILPEITNIFPDHKVYDRTTLNTWEDEPTREAIKNLKRKKIIVGALWTEVCLTFPVLSMLKEGYEVYFLEDTSAGQSKQIHKAGVHRMMQAGAIPVTWVQVLCELQRDWNRLTTYNGVMEILQKHAGAFGTGIFYAKSFCKNSKA